VKGDHAAAFLLGGPMSLRRRLSALVAIALVPSLLLSVYNAARWRIFLEDEAKTTALSAARSISAEFDLVIENSRQLDGNGQISGYPGS
jgi:sensor histidine kinase regulating citrate/malate metabolism